MKRIRIFLLLLVGLILLGCDRADSSPLFYQDGDFDTEISYTVGQQTYTALYQKRGSAKTLTFSAPSTLSGMSAAMDGDGGITLCVGDLSFAADVGAEGLFLVTELFEVPRGCLRKAENENGVLLMDGESGENKYSLVLDAAGLPLKLEGVFSGVPISAQVINFTMMTQEDG